MIGVSLPLKWLISGEGDPGNRDAVLSELRRKQVDSVELRTVRPQNTPEEVLRCAERLWEYGFQVTVHGSAKSVETAVEEVFAPLRDLLGNLRQEKLTVTIHPIRGDNAALLTVLSDYALANRFPVIIALENNRLLPDKQEGDCAALVLDAVKAVDRENVGICFDMGHYAYYRQKNCPEEPEAAPDKEFLKRVVHTHIHGLNGLRTHFPLSGYPLPLKQWVEALAFEYFGVYNVELDFPRFQGLYEPLPALLDSVAALQEVLPICAKLYDEVRQKFDGWFRSAAAVLESDGPGTRLGLIHSTSYLFNTDGFSWAMDIAFRNARVLAKTPSMAAEILKPLRLMVITHGHRDHFEESTVRLMAENELQWIIPDFLVEKALEWGLNPEKVITARKGEWITVGPLRLLPFEGRHVRPDSGKGPKEYGFYVQTPQGLSLAFPGDTRDYSPEGAPQLPMADYCFAHVWLGDKQGLKAHYGDKPAVWASYMLRFSDRKLLLTHLNEDGRPDDSMWRQRHALLLADAVRALSPETAVYIPARGEVLEL